MTLYAFALTFASLDFMHSTIGPMPPPFANFFWIFSAESDREKRQ
jgi:hypothetical protein